LALHFLLQYLGLAPIWQISQLLDGDVAQQQKAMDTKTRIYSPRARIIPLGHFVNHQIGQHSICKAGHRE